MFIFFRHVKGLNTGKYMKNVGFMSTNSGREDKLPALWFYIVILF